MTTFYEVEMEIIRIAENRLSLEVMGGI